MLVTCEKLSNFSSTYFSLIRYQTKLLDIQSLIGSLAYLPCLVYDKVTTLQQSEILISYWSIPSFNFNLFHAIVFIHHSNIDLHTYILRGYSVQLSLTNFVLTIKIKNLGIS